MISMCVEICMKSVNVLLLCQERQVRVTLLARSTEYRRIINQQEVNALSLSLCSSLIYHSASLTAHLNSYLLETPAW